MTINAATPFVVRVSSNPLLADGDSDGVSDLAEKQLAQSTTASQRVDAENRPYHPNILNSPPVQVYTADRRSDGIMGRARAVRHTTTMVANAPLSYAVLDVARLCRVGRSSPGAASIAVGRTAPQTATQGYRLYRAEPTQHANGGDHQQRCARGWRNTGTPGFVFDPIVSEAAVGQLCRPQRRAQRGPCRLRGPTGKITSCCRH